MKGLNRYKKKPDCAGAASQGTLELNVDLLCFVELADYWLEVFPAGL